MNNKGGTYLELLDRIQNYRWPKKGDRLLVKGQDLERDAEFSDDVISRHVHIWDGNMRAAELLIRACDEGSPHRHSLVYPILFTYRHAMELAMKWVILNYSQYSNVEVGDFQHHNLWKLWCTCRQILAEFESGGDDVLAVEQIVKDFHDLDGSAITFRYGYSKDGKLVELPGYPISLSNIQDVMEGVGHFFSGVDGQLNAYCSNTDR